MVCVVLKWAHFAFIFTGYHTISSGLQVLSATSHTQWIYCLSLYIVSDRQPIMEQGSKLALKNYGPIS